MNIQEYVLFLGRIRFRDTVDTHKENLEKIAEIIERITAGTYEQTFYTHRPTHIVPLAEIKNDKQYLPILEKILTIKLDNLKEVRQNELYEVSKKQKKWPKPVKFPPEHLVKKINALLDAYEVELAKEKMHPRYKFTYLKGKATIKPGAHFFQTNDFPSGSYEEEKVVQRFGKNKPDFLFCFEKKVPKVVLNPFVVEKVGMAGKETELQQILEKILKDGLKKTMTRIIELNKQLDETIKNLK